MPIIESPYLKVLNDEPPVVTNATIPTWTSSNDAWPNNVPHIELPGEVVTRSAYDHDQVLMEYLKLPVEQRIGYYDSVVAEYAKRQKRYRAFVLLKMLIRTPIEGMDHTTDLVLLFGYTNDESFEEAQVKLVETILAADAGILPSASIGLE